MRTCKLCDKHIEKGRTCRACINRKHRANSPERYAYQALKDNAKRRGKPFEITFQEFKDFCKKVGYMRKKGITRDSYHIDREDETKGYVAGNLQILTNVDNVRKYLRYAYDPHERKMEYTTETLKDTPQTDTPF